MAASDARPVPRKNAAWRVYFAIRKSDGTLITSWTGADSEVSKDGGSFADCTDEATEVGTSGCGYLDLSASEMNADAVTIKITVTNTGALPLVLTVFPEEAGDYRADVTHFGGTAGTFSSGRPEVNTTHWADTAVGSANVLIDGAITAAKLATDAITAAKIATDAITAAKIAADAVAEIQSGLASQTSVDTLTTYVDTEVAAIKAKTDNLPADPADASDITAAFGTVNSTLTTIAGYIDTEVAAIKAKTDNLPSDPADQSAVEAAITAAIATIPTAGQNADAVWDEVLTGATHNIAGSAGRRLRQLASVIVHSGTAQGPGADGNQIQLDAGASSTNGAYDPGLIYIETGTGAGQARLILQYNGSTKIATVDRDWRINPDNTSEFVIIADAGRESVNEGLAQAGTATTITLNANASSNDDAYNGQLVFIRSGLGQDQVALVEDYVGSTKVATIRTRSANGQWAVTPDTTSAYVMLPNLTWTISEIQNGLATAANQTTILDRQAYTLAVLAGACADPQTASETYVLTIGGSTYTVDMAGQTSTGTRTAPTLTKT